MPEGVPEGKVRLSELSKEEIAGLAKRQFSQIKDLQQQARELAARSQRLKDENTRLRQGMGPQAAAAAQREADERLELEARIQGLLQQVELYKQELHELRAQRQPQQSAAQREEAELMQVRLQSLEEKSDRDEAALRAADEKRRELESRVSELETVKAEAEAAAASARRHREELLAAPTAAVDAAQLPTLLQERELQVAELQRRMEETEARLKGLTSSQDAFLQQTREESEAELRRKLAVHTQEHTQERLQWDEERGAMVRQHQRDLQELRQERDDLLQGVQGSREWLERDRELSRTRDSLKELRLEAEAKSRRIQDMETEVSALQSASQVKSDTIASLREQVLEAETDMAETRELCRSVIARSVLSNDSVDRRAAAAVKGSNVSTASSCSTPPPSPDHPARGRDLFDGALAPTGRHRASRREQELERQLVRYREFERRVRQEEESRKRSMDEVESNRADMVNQLVRERDSLKLQLAAAGGDQAAVVPTSDVVRLRGDFQRERETWEETRIALEEERDALLVSVAELSDAQKQPTGEDERCVELTRERDALTAKVAELESSAGEIGVLRSQVSDLQTEKAERESRFQNLSQEVLQLQERMRGTEERRQSINARARQLEQQLSSDRAKFERQSSVVRELEGRISALDAENARLRSQLRDAGFHPPPPPARAGDTQSEAATGGQRGGAELPDFLRPSQGESPTGGQTPPPAPRRFPAQTAAAPPTPPGGLFADAPVSGTPHVGRDGASLRPPPAVHRNGGTDAAAATEMLAGTPAPRPAAAAPSQPPPLPPPGQAVSGGAQTPPPPAAPAQAAPAAAPAAAAAPGVNAGTEAVAPPAAAKAAHLASLEQDRRKKLEEMRQKFRNMSRQ
eukprot:TRINITY_DN8424_c2_g1_i1.p1 TRINITY_DN8424_c2_g1~~TRINITY_DN8424_c2_g1_i1.p1  ORF type:complete len:866 (+),score=304.13 TRINITY_DN8424_c2_g1_i1:85-2682(+)